jgi:hypothetical protein
MEYHGIWFCNLPMFEGSFYHLIQFATGWFCLAFPHGKDPPHQGAGSTLGWPMAARHAANSYRAGDSASSGPICHVSWFVQMGGIKPTIFIMGPSGIYVGNRITKKGTIPAITSEHTHHGTGRRQHGRVLWGGMVTFLRLVAIVETAF